MIYERVSVSFVSVWLDIAAGGTCNLMKNPQRERCEMFQFMHEVVLGLNHTIHQLRNDYVSTDALLNTILKVQLHSERQGCTSSSLRITELSEYQYR